MADGCARSDIKKIYASLETSHRIRVIAWIFMQFKFFSSNCFSTSWRLIALVRWAMGQWWSTFFFCRGSTCGLRFMGKVFCVVYLSLQVGVFGGLPEVPRGVWINHLGVLCNLVGWVFIFFLDPQHIAYLELRGLLCWLRKICYKIL